MLNALPAYGVLSVLKMKNAMLRHCFFALALISMFGCQSNSTEADHTAAGPPKVAEEKKVASSPATPPIEEETTAILFDSTNYEFDGEYILINWPLLANVEFIEEFDEDIQAYIPYPDFKPIVEALDGKKVQIQGYVIPTDETGGGDIIVLSANPFSSCFFCGAAGPESVMDIKLKKPRKNLKTDQLIVLRGQLKLNDSDLYYLNYILEGAELL